MAGKPIPTAAADRAGQLAGCAAVKRLYNAVPTPIVSLLAMASTVLA